MKFAGTGAQGKISELETSTGIPSTAQEQQPLYVEHFALEQASRPTATTSQIAGSDALHPFNKNIQNDNFEVSQQSRKNDQSVENKRQDTSEKLSAESSGKQKCRLQFEDEQPHTAATLEPEKADLSHRERRYERAVQRVEKAEKRVEKACESLPTKRRLSIEKEFDSETGKPRRKLHFETEVQPEYKKPSIPVRVGGMAKSAAVMKLHSKIRESERENVSVEATHKGELMAEQGAGRFLRWNKTHRRSQPYRALRNAERQAAKEKANLAWQTALRDHPEPQKQHTLAKWAQKQQIKRKYAQATHESKQAAQFTQNILTSTGQIVRAVAQQVMAQKSMLLIVALLALIVVFFSAGMTSCTAMLSGIQNAYISTAYMANEEDICEADLYYTELETDLQLSINKTEEDYPGYDEYRYNIGEINHNPYELMGYL